MERRLRPLLLWRLLPAEQLLKTALRACSYSVTNDGTLTVMDHGKNNVWSSTTLGKTFGVQRKLQLVSNSAPELSCIWSGPDQAPSVLASRDGKFLVMVDEAGLMQVRG